MVCYPHVRIPSAGLTAMALAMFLTYFVFAASEPAYCDSSVVVTAPADTQNNPPSNTFTYSAAAVVKNLW